MEKAERLTCEQAANLMGVKTQFIRLGLQQGRFPFGWAVQTGKQTGSWTYWIGKTKFEETTGLKAD